MFSREPIRRGGLVLGYAAVNEQEIRDGMHSLAMAIRSLPHPHGSAAERPEPGR